MEKYTIKEYEELIKLGLRYKELQEHKRVIVLPCPLETMVYQVVPDCEHCAKAKGGTPCKGKPKGCKKKVMPCLFTADLIEAYGKTVFGTEPEAIVASVS